MSIIIKNEFVKILHSYLYNITFHTHQEEFKLYDLVSKILFVLFIFGYNFFFFYKQTNHYTVVVIFK